MHDDSGHIKRGIKFNIKESGGKGRLLPISVIRHESDGKHKKGPGILCGGAVTA